MIVPTQELKLETSQEILNHAFTFKNAVNKRKARIPGKVSL